MEIIPTALDGVVEIRPARHGDDRGWFSEVYKRHTLRDAGIDIEFVQDNESFSAPAGTLRGLHYQLPRTRRTSSSASSTARSSTSPSTSAAGPPRSASTSPSP